MRKVLKGHFIAGETGNVFSVSTYKNIIKDVLPKLLAHKGVVLSYLIEDVSSAKVLIGLVSNVLCLRAIPEELECLLPLEIQPYVKDAKDINVHESEYANNYFDTQINQDLTKEKYHLLVKHYRIEAMKQLSNDLDFILTFGKVDKQTKGIIDKVPTEIIITPTGELIVYHLGTEVSLENYLMTMGVK